MSTLPRLASSGGGPVSVRWLGTAGFELECEGTHVLVDPYLTRASLFQCATSRLVPDAAEIARVVRRADAVVAGHTHFDHVLDVPAIAKQTGARVFGSRSCAELCRASGVAEQKIVDVESSMRREPFRVEIGPFDIRFIPSVHSPLAAGRVPFPGEISDCDAVPLRVHEYRCGAVFAVDFRVAGRRIYHLGSANLIDGATPRGPIDLALVCVAGWQTAPRFIERVTGQLDFGAVWLSHWDAFWTPLEHGSRLLPAMSVPRLVDGLARARPDIRTGVLDYLEPFAV
jgi:L-ascorbate metabolism protein UlaG (beta-lactamase superfamily)